MFVYLTTLGVFLFLHEIFLYVMFLKTADFFFCEDNKRNAGIVDKKCTPTMKSKKYYR